MTDKIKQVRDNFDLRILEMTQAVLKIDAAAEVIKVFEAAQQGDEEAQEKINKAGVNGKPPSGFMMTDLGIVDIETKEALLTAQAAERTYRVIEEIEHFYAVHVPEIQNIASRAGLTKVEDMQSNWYAPQKPEIKAYYDAHIKPADIENPMFPYIGNKGEGYDLILAQATQQVATEYQRNEYIGVRHEVEANTLKIGNFVPLGTGYISGFKQSVADSYTKAANVLRTKGFEDVANDIEEVVASIEIDQTQAILTPKQCAESLIDTQNKLANLENSQYLDPEAAKIRRMTVDTKWENTMTSHARRSLGLTG